MWTPFTGYEPGEMGDIEVLVHQDRLHLFHLCLPSHDAVAHCVSDDGIHWQPLPVAIRTGDPGEPDDDQIWTMGVFAHAGRFFMLYTGLDKAHLGLKQSICLAVSDDLIRWTKHSGNPVMRPDPRWYEDRLLNPSRIDWRDPFVFQAEGQLQCLITARLRDGALNRRACVGHATSSDGVQWNVQPPLWSPHVCFDVEVPTLFPLGKRWYLTGIFGGQERQAYRVADHWRGPWRRPADDSTLPTRNHAFRVARWRDMTLLFHWYKALHPMADWRSGYSKMTLCLPKLASSDEDGNLRISSFPLLTRDRTPMPCAKSLVLDGKDQIGFASSILTDDFDDGVIEVTFRTLAPEFGLYIRGDLHGDTGTFFSCVPGRNQVELYKLTHQYSGMPSHLVRGRVLVQTFHHRFVPGEDVRLRLVAHGPEIEASVNGRVVLCALTMLRRDGAAGVYVEDGSATVDAIEMTRLPRWSENPFER